MCGIAGYVSQTAVDSTHDIARMSEAIAHRGPDDAGFTLIGAGDSSLPRDFCGSGSDPEITKLLPPLPPRRAHNIAFAHLRYSVFDLSVRGHQPMWDSDGRTCVSFNGEIYNHIELREELEAAGYNFVSTSDTEVLLHGYDYWGPGLFERLNGPAAMAIYDSNNGEVVLARDRLGKAPLYTALWKGRLYWASEIKAIRAVCDSDAFEVSPKAVDDFLVLGLRDADGTFWQGIDDFPAAHWAVAKPSMPLETRRYWDFPTFRFRPGDIGIPDATTALRQLLGDALQLRLRADVPVAFELSGGLDSSSLVALAAADLGQSISTYSVRFNSPKADESEFAQAVCDRYPQEIDPIWFTPPNTDFWQDAGDFVHLQEEPFHSPNLHTLHKLRGEMRAAGAKVVIAGSAGDEVLAGYAGDYTTPYLAYLLRHMSFAQIARGAMHGDEFRAQLPSSVRRIASGAFRTMLGKKIGHTEKSTIIDNYYLPDSDQVSRPYPSMDFDELWKMNMTWRRMNYWLRSGNKATFGVPIESRAPFLDHRVVEFCCRLPPEYLIRDGWFKWMLRKSVEPILPASVVWRRNKLGFPFPYEAWFADSEERIKRILSDLDCPWISTKSLGENYESASKLEPLALWRLVSFAMWWRQEIEGRSI